MAKLSGHLFRDTTNFRWRSWHVCGGQVTMFRESLVDIVPADPFEFQQCLCGRGHTCGPLAVVCATVTLAKQSSGVFSDEQSV